MNFFILNICPGLRLLMACENSGPQNGATQAACNHLRKCHCLPTIINTVSCITKLCRPIMAPARALQSVCKTAKGQNGIGNGPDALVRSLLTLFFLCVVSWKSHCVGAGGMPL